MTIPLIWIRVRSKEKLIDMQNDFEDLQTLYMELRTRYVQVCKQTGRDINL